MNFLSVHYNFQVARLKAQGAIIIAKGTMSGTAWLDLTIILRMAAFKQMRIVYLVSLLVL